MPKARKRRKPGPPKVFAEGAGPSFRCTEAERKAWDAAADRAGKTLSAWIRETLNAAATPTGGGV